ncbi:hypothetical protein AN477_13145 [Alicyclobacillus ferrooxydans]|uniref:Uncharacterized protein n=1 Tax=Alicyclobacillus ferrooxydans TaxID=471514 RepID=A0A0P9D1D8_9BACL|nr:hypothetical protein AN477_13145 [Alicyclobacillus ferrooxydans]
MVEQKNLLRQYFLEQDIGRKKAEVLAERYSRAYGIDIAAYSEYLTAATNLKEIGVEDGSIVVGAWITGLHDGCFMKNYISGATSYMLTVGTVL